MKNSTQHLIFVQAVIVTFLLTGCSNENTSKGPTVRDSLAEVISASEMSGPDNIDKEPSLAPTGNPNIKSSVVRSPSSKAFYRPAKEPAVQKIQGQALQATNALEIKSGHEAASNESVIRRAGTSNKTSNRHQTVLVGDTLKDVLGSRNTTREPTVRDAVINIIPAVEISVDDDITEKSEDE
jgi:hypothetical protein